MKNKTIKPPNCKPVNHPFLEYLPFTRAKEISAGTPHRRGTKYETLDTVFLASEVLLGIFELSSRAVAGEKLAAGCLQKIASEASIELREIVEDCPETMKDFIQGSPQWPMMISLHPENEKANRAFLKRTKLGEKAEINARAGARWSRENPATVWANDVVETIRANQRRFRLLKKNPPAWVTECAKLPPLSKATAPKWWKVGKQAILEKFPEPHKIPELAKLAQNEDDDSRKKARVLYLIGRAIYSIASK